MVFPATPLPQKHELLINGVWTDVSSYVRGLTGTGAVTITRGYSGQQAQISPGSVAFSLNNRDNRFSNKNPTGPYYRMLGRNTQYRCSVDTGTVFAKFLDASTLGSVTYDGSTIWTADKASLDIVGDIDITVDVDADDWRGRRGHILASKWVRGTNDRSWAFTINPDGYLCFIWTTNGTGSTIAMVKSPVPVWPTGRIALRVLVDVDNGSGGWSIGFFTAPTLLGTTTPLGSTIVTTGGITSIFSGAARVELGTADNGADRGATFSGALSDADPFTGRFYGFRLRSGLGGGGTTVAQMDTTTQAAGTTSWSDGLASPNTWTVTGSSYLTSYDFRFWGELPSLPRLADTSVTDIYVNARAADILQRLTQGNNAKPLESAVKRNLKQYAWDGYWPMEDKAITGSGFAAYYGQAGYQSNGSLTGNAPSGFLGSAGSLTFNDDTGYASGNTAISAGTPTVSTVLCYFQFGTAPSTSTQQTFFNAYYAGGTAYRSTFSANNSTFGLTINDVYGNSLVNVVASYSGLSLTQWLAMRLKMTASGGTITWEWAWYQVNANTPFGSSGTFSGTLSRPQSWISWPFPGKSGFQLAHVAFGRMDLDFTGSDFTNSTNAYNGETWYVRARRLAAEQDQQLYIQGSNSRDSMSSFVKKMGAQSPKSFVDLLQECADVAGGQLFAPRDKFGLTIRAWECMANQIGGSQLQLDYAQNQLSGTLQPSPDDFLVENDVTLTQPDGQSFRYPKTTGSLNTGDPLSGPDAIGTYDVTDTTNTYTAADLEAQVRRRVLFGTWDEERYPQIQVNLERGTFTGNAALTAQARKLDLGRAFSIVNPGSWLAVNQIDLMAVGYTETLGQMQHQIVANTRPAGPWMAGIWGSSTQATTSLWGPQSTTLNAGVNTTATSIVITTPDVYELWTYVSNYLIEIAGERMTVTACSARSGTGPYTYTLTVTRSTNGVVKSLSATEPVTVPAVGRWG